MDRRAAELALVEVLRIGADRRLREEAGPGAAGKVPVDVDRRRGRVARVHPDRV